MKTMTTIVQNPRPGHTSLLFKGVALALALSLLSGCAGLFGKKEEDEDRVVQEIIPYMEPDPGQSVGLRRIWDTSVGSSPDKYLMQPGQFALSGRDIFVGTFQGQVARLRWDDGDVVWKSTAGSQVSGGVAADKDQVYVGTVEGDIVALARADGHELWRSKASSVIASAPVADKGKVLFVTLDNHTYSIRPSDGKLDWLHTAVSEPLTVMGAATPTIIGDLVFVGYSTGELYALKLSNGESLWTENLKTISGRSEVDMLQDLDASPVIYSRKVYAVNHQGNLVALYPDKGARVWEQPASAVRTPLALDGKIIISTVEGELAAFGADDGFQNWKTRLSDGLLTAPVFLRGRIVVADSAGRLFSVDPSSGRVTGKDKLGTPIYSNPMVLNDNLFLFDNDGRLTRYE